MFDSHLKTSGVENYQIKSGNILLQEITDLVREFKCNTKIKKIPQTGDTDSQPMWMGALMQFGFLVFFFFCRQSGLKVLLKCHGSAIEMPLKCR